MMVEGRGGNRSGGRGQAQERKRSWLPSTTLLFFRLHDRSSTSSSFSSSSLSCFSLSNSICHSRSLRRILPRPNCQSKKRITIGGRSLIHSELEYGKIFGILQTDSILIFENFNRDWIISIHLQKNTTVRSNFNTLLWNITSNTSIRIICIVATSCTNTKKTRRSFPLTF